MVNKTFFLHDILGFLNPKVSVESAIKDRCSGNSFMSYSRVEKMIVSLLSGHQTLDQLLSGIEKNPKFYGRHAKTYAEILKLVDGLREVGTGRFWPFKDRKLQISKNESCKVKIDGLWNTIDGPCLFLILKRKNNILLDESSYPIVATGIRRVFPEKEFNELPIQIIDLKAPVLGGDRRFFSKTYLKEDEVPWREVQYLLDLFVEAKNRVTVSVERQERKKQYDPNQRELF